jgi:citrate synthase
MNAPDNRWMHTEMGSTTPTTITVCGMDLADDIMGKISFPDRAFRMVAGRLPNERESVLFNAVLVSLADHGITPTVLAARLTYLGAPEALQGAVAAGVLGGGSVFLGVAEDAARFLDETLTGLPPNPDDRALRTAAATAVAALREQGRRTPGLGHPVHKQTDPRVPRMYALAEQLELLGPHLRLLELVAEASDEQSNRHLPINGAGVAGAALADLGFDWRIIRGFALLARTAGLLGHLAEEMREPMAMPLWQMVEAGSAD